MGLKFSSSKILCIQRVRLIHLMSLIVQPKAFLCPLKTLRSFSSSKEVRLLLTITGLFSPSSRKAYLREEGRGLSSSFSSLEELSSLLKSCFQILFVERNETSPNERW